MAKDTKKKAPKRGKDAKTAKLKVPKQVGGVKIPKALRREGDKLIDALKGLIATEIAAAAITALARSPRRKPPPTV